VPDQTLRILLTNIGWKPAQGLGGPIVSVAALAERMAGRGHEVTVFTTDAGIEPTSGIPRDRPVEVDGVRVWYFSRKEPLQELLPFVPYLSDSMGFAYAPALGRELARELPTFDCVNTQSPFIYPALAAGRGAIRHGVPLFCHQRGNLLPTHLGRRAFKKSAYMWAFERRILVRATTLVALNDAERVAFRRWAPKVPCPIVPNGIELPDPRLAAEAAVACRAEFGIGVDSQVVLFLGRIHPWKRVDVLIDAFGRIAGCHPKAILLVAGDMDAEQRAQFARQLGALGLDGRVIFAGRVSGTRKLGILAMSDLFCLPSMGEGFSVATLEAMSHGMPVVLSPECNMPEVVRIGAGAVATADAPSFAREMSAFLGDRDLRRRAAAAARRMAESRSWDAVVDRLLDVYAEGIDRHRRQA
jgi:glycosyltransferase involved in cell wall biosynthesis